MGPGLGNNQGGLDSVFFQVRQGLQSDAYLQSYNWYLYNSLPLWLTFDIPKFVGDKKGYGFVDFIDQANMAKACGGPNRIKNFDIKGKIYLSDLLNIELSPM